MNLKLLLAGLLAAGTASAAVMTGPSAAGGAYTFNPTLVTSYTNYGALATGVVFVDGVEGSDSTGTGSPSAPFRTLLKGQTTATNGMTVYGTRGTFAESDLGKPGIGWYFNDGVYLAGNPNFRLGTNGVTNLTVAGACTVTNNIVIFDDVTNCVASVTAKNYTGGANTAVSCNKGTSNTFYLNVDQFTGTLFSSLDEYSGVTYSNRTSRVVLTGRQRLTVNPAASASGNTNIFVYISAPEVWANGNGWGGTLNSVHLQADWFSRNGKTLTSIQSNYWFKGVSFLTTNDCNTNLPLRGTWYLER